MHDLPTGPQLLTLAHGALLAKLMPLLPSEARLDALLLGDCLAIAAREARAAAAPVQAIDDELRGFYRSNPPREPTSPADRTHSPSPVAASCCEAGAGKPDLWRRFACDLRVGAFTGAPLREGAARAVLWRLTIAKLRLANPRFLAANGFAQGEQPGDYSHVA
jgi:hypothetical protein